jgi:hypothetical protein
MLRFEALLVKERLAGGVVHWRFVVVVVEEEMVLRRGA